MFHKIDYIQKGKRKQVQSSMIVEGENKYETAMSKNSRFASWYNH
ncbi:MAG: hypothetical protein KatS3mg068_2540 [Candidatus Sericytochromatia bacterium]|nr:MAG: hypothetical protein KatS3mg068_2540 [Candidatus Sericytochromatia bacterium]